MQGIPEHEAQAAAVADRLSRALSDLEAARLAVAVALWDAICVRGEPGDRDTLDVWCSIDRRLRAVGYPETGTPSSEFLLGCCLIR